MGNKTSKINASIPIEGTKYKTNYPLYVLEKDNQYILSKEPVDIHNANIAEIASAVSYYVPANSVIYISSYQLHKGKLQVLGKIKTSVSDTGARSWIWSEKIVVINVVLKIVGNDFVDSS